MRVENPQWHIPAENVKFVTFNACSQKAVTTIKLEYTNSKTSEIVIHSYHQLDNVFHIYTLWSC